MNAWIASPIPSFGTTSRFMYVEKPSPHKLKNVFAFGLSQSNSAWYWYEETLPPDSLFYVLFAERSEGALEKTKALFADKPYLQAGGNETVGHGWFAMSNPLEGGQS